MDLRPLSIIMAVAYAYILCSASAIQFDVHGSDTKCFSEELNLKGVVLAGYHAVSDNVPKFSARVTSPYGRTIYSQERVTEGEFAFTADEAGDYTACFWVPDASRESTVTIDLDWKTGIAAKDWESVAKRDKIKGVELELMKLENAAKTIHENMLYLRHREEKMRHVNEITNSRMAWFSICSLSICLIAAALQLWHLKSFFVRKKLL